MKSERIYVKLTLSEKEVLKGIAARRNLNVSDYIRSKILFTQNEEQELPADFSLHLIKLMARCYSILHHQALGIKGEELIESASIRASEWLKERGYE